MPVYIMYKIHCNITGEDYYGHTKKTLSQRLSRHRAEANSTTRKTVCTSIPIINRGDYEMIEIEKWLCASKTEAIARERYWIENNECVNMIIPGRTKAEYYALDPEKWKEYHSNYSKNHYIKNKEKFIQKRHDNKDAHNAYCRERTAWLNSWDGNSGRRGLNQISIDLFD